MRVRILLLIAAVALTACSRASAPPPETGPDSDKTGATDAAALPAAATEPATSVAPTPTAKAEPSPQPATDWRRQAELLVKEGRWAEAVEAGQKAVAADRDHAGAWYILGRAQLGAGQIEAAAVTLKGAQDRYPDYVPEISLARGQVNEALGNIQQAAHFYESVHRLSPDMGADKRMEQLRTKYGTPLPAWVGDLDGDGCSDLIRLEGNSLQLFSCGKERILERRSESGPLKVEVYPLPSGPLVREERPGCSGAGENRFLWYDRTSHQIRVFEPEEPCGHYAYLGNGRIERSLYGSPLIRVERMVWSGAGLKVEQTAYRLTRFPFAQWDQVLTAISGAPVENPQLMMRPELYQRFMERIQADPGRWEFRAEAPPSGGKLRLLATRDGRPAGALLLTEGTRGALQDLVWEDSAR